MMRTALVSLLLAAAVHADTFPIVDVEHGFLLGASGDGRFLKMEDAAKTMHGGEQYHLYTLTERLGVVKGGKPHSFEEPCPDQQVINLAPKPKSGVIAFAGPWNALPRVPKIQDTTQPVYQKAVADFLFSKGIRTPKVKITKIIRVDLDGDGEDEVLISATNYLTKDGSAPSSAPAGSYSCVLVRRTNGDRVQTQLIDGEFYPKGETFNVPNWYEISAILDLDGDGKMEVILDSGYYEGGGTAVYSVTGKKPKQLLIVGCGA
ncbi:MAG TPA: VCBS repeat-containing protein [Chthoniobacter sp.]|nr:VCBS repeat-containing protein [Chthoniobacter sp.]